MTAITPMRAQLTAADPALSVWVSANAGTGKTKVLTDRVLRLLLQGTPPSRILCITYTKAAAAEMENRIHHTLSEWVALSNAELAAALRLLTEAPASARLVQRARSLFATVLDAPEGVRIQTIHSFCQSLLRRFPLEAGVQPHFEVIDERTAKELVAEARQRLFLRVLQEDNPQERWLRESIALLAGRLGEGQFQSLLERLISERRRIAPALRLSGGAVRLIAEAYHALGLHYGQQEEPLFAAAFHYAPQEESALRSAINALNNSGKNDSALAQALAAWFEVPLAQRRARWDAYRAAWVKVDGGLRQVPSKSVLKAHPELEDVLAEEGRRVLRYDNALRALYVAQYTEAAINIIDGLLILYSHLKDVHQFLDYEDLIQLALRLLRMPNIAPWVLYKLDGGLDHLLIDEAQDTSPEQWELIELLVHDFFAGQGRETPEGRPRTLFVVGDEKQSIFSFQGAAPRTFSGKSFDFEARAKGAQVAFEPLSLSTSFRSCDAVLRVVDAVIAQPHISSGLSFGRGLVPHKAAREGHAGEVEIWPPVFAPEREECDIWRPGDVIDAAPDAQSILAERIANRVRHWLDAGELLESRGRPIEPGDILVLVRKRNAFITHLVRALKRHKVPVAGVDRMMLTENIAVMDLLALAEFLLLPEDDLSLACVLKSPLCGMGEEQLFALAHGRGKASLWSRVQADAAMRETAGLLRDLLERVDYIRPYELFAHVLEGQGGRQRFALRMGAEVFDPLDEFLALALDYERSHAPSLQGFLHWLRSGDTEVKRDMEQGMNAVRIMTVHSSKGLQAPIVFLPDTVAPPSGGTGGGKAPPLLWTERNGKPVALWSPSGKEDDEFTAALRAACKAEEEEESRRLLYVAMTRAEDRLYIGGAMARNRKNVPEDCWYSWIRSGVADWMEPCSFTFPPLRAGEEAEEVEGWRYRTAQTAPPKTAAAEQQRQVMPAMPDFLRMPPAPEPYPPQPLVPSRRDEETVVASSGGGAVLSPVEDTARFQRGNLIHRLLQWLPDTAPEKRQAAAESYLARYAPELEEAGRQKLWREVEAVLAAPEMAPVFTPDALAEVPVSGLISLDGAALPRILSGQIDRLRVTDDAVWIVDYKTQRTPPATPQDVPAAYLRQMAVYRAALMRIYPRHTVHCALLWTAAPALMPLPAELLASSLDSPQG